MQETKYISAYKQNLKGKIEATAMDAFKENGIKAVKMDDVASRLGISKRTLYEIYENKELLIYEGVKHYHERRQAEFTEIASKCQNVMEIIVQIYRVKVEEFQVTNPLFFADLAKYPKVARYLNQQNQQMRKNSIKFIERGVNEGYFRKEVHLELVGQLFDALGKFVMENQLYRQYPIEAVFKNLIFITLRGICTDKGIKALDSII